MRYGFIFVISIMVLSCSTYKNTIEQDKYIRVASYNIEYGRRSSPKQIAKMFKPYDLDIIGFDEMPGGDWTEQIADLLGMKYFYLGKISSANHDDKYKSIISKTPLRSMEEIELNAEKGWNPASVVKAETTINGHDITFYSLHICASGRTDGHAYQLAQNVLLKSDAKISILVGDFNNKMGDKAISNIEKAGFRSTWKELSIEIENQKTYHAIDTTDFGVIDHIFYNKTSGLMAIDGGIIELKTPLSDHKPIWAKFRLTSATK